MEMSMHFAFKGRRQMTRQNVIVRSCNRFYKLISLTVLLLALSSPSLAKEITPQEINAKECKKFVESLFEDLSGFPTSKYLTKENGVSNCTNEMNNNYKNGLPSYATHTPRDVEDYREENRKKFADRGIG